MAVAPGITPSDLATLGVLPAGAPARLCPLAGGISSDIVKVESGDRVFVVKRALPRLRVAEEWLAPTSRNRHEADWLETIGRILPGAAPKVLARNDDAGLFAMEYLAPERFPVWKVTARQSRGYRLCRGSGTAPGDNTSQHRGECDNCRAFCDGGRFFTRFGWSRIWRRPPAGIRKLLAP